MLKNKAWLLLVMILGAPLFAQTPKGAKEKSTSQLFEELHQVTLRREQLIDSLNSISPKEETPYQVVQDTVTYSHYIVVRGSLYRDTVIASLPIDN